jgi:hypothetical protein
VIEWAAAELWAWIVRSTPVVAAVDVWYAAVEVIDVIAGTRAAGL